MTWQEHVDKCIYCGRFVALRDAMWLPGHPNLLGLDPPDDEAAHHECHEQHSAKVKVWQEEARQEAEAAAAKAGEDQSC